MHIIVIVVVFIFLLLTSGIAARQIIGRQMLVGELDGSPPPGIIATASTRVRPSCTRKLAARIARGAGCPGLPEGVLRGAYGHRLRSREESIHHDAAYACLGAGGGTGGGLWHAAEAADAAVHGEGLRPGERVERVREPLLIVVVVISLPQYRRHGHHLLLRHFLLRL
ncbi:hypothetical protein EE612_005849 [Oryza sativa]|nr:hypothetical protein EE612_005849 [Oryza sativa]